MTRCSNRCGIEVPTATSPNVGPFELMHECSSSVGYASHAAATSPSSVHRGASSASATRMRILPGKTSTRRAVIFCPFSIPEVYQGTCQRGARPAAPGSCPENPSETQKRPEGPHMNARKWSARAISEQRNADSGGQPPGTAGPESQRPAPTTPFRAPFPLPQVRGSSRDAPPASEQPRRKSKVCRPSA